MDFYIPFSISILSHHIFILVFDKGCNLPFLSLPFLCSFLSFETFLFCSYWNFHLSCNSTLLFLPQILACIKLDGNSREWGFHSLYSTLFQPLNHTPPPPFQPFYHSFIAFLCSSPTHSDSSCLQSLQCGGCNAVKRQFFTLMEYGNSEIDLWMTFNKSREQQLQHKSDMPRQDKVVKES